MTFVVVLLASLTHRLTVRNRHGPHPRTQARTWNTPHPTWAGAADKGYFFFEIRAYLRRGEILCRLDRNAYLRRNVVKGCFNRLKQNKALAIRHDKRARHYHGHGHHRLPRATAP